MTMIKCKRCGKDQNTCGLDQHHIFCLRHTGDDNEVGIGLVCLNARQIGEQSGVCPDCGLFTTKYPDGQVRGYEIDQRTGHSKEIFRV